MSNQHIKDIPHYYVFRPSHKVFSKHLKIFQSPESQSATWLFLFFRFTFLKL